MSILQIKAHDFLLFSMVHIKKQNGLSNILILCTTDNLF